MTILFEPGLGAARALVMDGDRVIEAHIERDDTGPRAGTVASVRLKTILAPGRRALALFDDGGEALIEPLPAHLTEGQMVRAEVVREGLHESARPRLPKLKLTDVAPAPGPDLAARLAALGQPVRTLAATDAEDRLEAAGWSELVEQARTGHVPFPGGLLTISPTPAMTVIDVDGPGDPVALAEAASIAAAAAIRRFGIGGSIGIDLPTLAGKAERARIGALLDQHLPPPFERTAVNGFGFVQIVRPRLRPSLLEAVRTPGFAALELLRRAARGPAGGRELIAHPSTIAWLSERPTLTAALGRVTGGAVTLRAEPGMAIWAGDVRQL